MATAHRAVLFVKGAPDVVMNYCSQQQLDSGSAVAIDRAFWEKKNEESPRGPACTCPCVAAGDGHRRGHF